MVLQLPLGLAECQTAAVSLYADETVKKVVFTSTITSHSGAAAQRAASVGNVQDV